ncbi:Hypothetical predicted protein [Paramuricea clavata]|uniref:UMOD/GP2/OIT3-like D8C domain-containing protein n=1 Tax=Paramuricea clavata TaxID=317549 RepID=A0A6S7J8K3_PARCT|nr:Hypothetical predicted protein [Paramuricea clavata]
MALSQWFLPNLVLIYYIFVTLINYGGTRNICKNLNYTTIRDERRSTSKPTQAGNILLCDRSVIQESIWYRFEIANGNQLATTRPKINHCGTYSPIWINGSHPTVADGKVFRKACAFLPFSLPHGCAYSYKITVLNCSGFYVYRLKPPDHCYLAYCIASNQTSNRTTSPPPGKSRFIKC